MQALTISIKEWDIIRSNVTLKVNDQLIDDNLPISNNVHGQKKGTLMYSFYHRGGAKDDVYHKTTTYKKSKFEYIFSFTLQHAKYSGIRVDEEFFYSEWK